MRKFYLFGLIALAVVLIGPVFADEMTLSTYYPAPAGVYREFTVTQNANFATERDAFDNPIGRVGIGTTQPGRTLHIVGSEGMRLEPSELPATGTEVAGDIVIDTNDDNTLNWWDGTAWVSAGGGGGCYIAFFHYTKSQKNANSGTLKAGQSCPGGFTDMGSVGEYGSCWYRGTTFGYAMQPGGGCDDGGAYPGYGADTPIYFGQGHLCCK